MHFLQPSRAILPRVCLALAALPLLSISGSALFAPAWFASGIDFRLTSSVAVSELQTVYGGLYLGLGTFFLIAALWPPVRLGALVMLTLSAFGALVVRLATVPLDDPRAEILIGLEVVLFLLGLTGLAVHLRDGHTSG